MVNTQVPGIHTSYWTVSNRRDGKFGELAKRFHPLFFFTFRTAGKTLVDKLEVDNKLQHKGILCDLKVCKFRGKNVHGTSNTD